MKGKPPFFCFSLQCLSEVNKPLPLFYCPAAATISSVVSQITIEAKGMLHLLFAPTPVGDKQVAFAFLTSSLIPSVL
jgi:hypothetical protein